MLPYEVDIENQSENNDLWNISEEIDSSQSNIDDKEYIAIVHTPKKNSNPGRGTAININPTLSNDGSSKRIGSEYNTQFKSKSSIDWKIKSRFANSKKQNRKSF